MKNPVAQAKPTTVGIFLLTVMWAGFQWKDPTPPPVLDQILVASYGVWFANEQIDRKKKNKQRDEDDEDPADKDEGVD